MKLQLRVAMFLARMTSAMVSGAARADEVPLITGATLYVDNGVNTTA